MNPFKSLALIATSALVLVSCQKEETFSKQSLTLDLDNAANNPVLSGQPEFVPNELLVKFKSGTSVAARGEALGLLGASVQEHIHTAAMRRANDMEGVFLLKVNANAMDAIVKAKGLGEVEYAEPNWIYTHDAVSNDPGFGNLWGMQTSWGSQAVKAWDNNHTGSDQVYIGIIDEGYMYTHADLKDNAGVNPKEIAGNKIDDDGNGYVDDVSEILAAAQKLAKSFDGEVVNMGYSLPENSDAETKVNKSLENMTIVRKQIGRASCRERV